MSVRKSDDFVADVERQYEWYVLHADWEVAEQYLAAVAATCRLCSHNTRSLARAADLRTRACATGASSSCFVLSKSTFSSTK